MCISVLPMHLRVYLWMSDTCRGRRCHIPKNQSYRWFWTTLCVLATEPCSSARVTNTHNQWDNSSAPPFSLRLIFGRNVFSHLLNIHSLVLQCWKFTYPFRSLWGGYLMHNLKKSNTFSWAAYISKLRILKLEVGKFPWGWGQPGLHFEFQAREDYMVRLFQHTNKTNDVF